MNRRLLGASALAVVTVGVSIMPAHGGYGEFDDDGPGGGTYIAEVDASITIEGDTTSGGGGTVSVSVPARCVWSEIDYDPEQFRDFVGAVTGSGAFPSPWLWTIFLIYNPLGFFLPEQDVLDEAVEIWDDGETPVSWYVLSCADDTDPEYRRAYIQHCAMNFPELCFPSPFTYAVEEDEPPVIIDPEELAVSAREFLHIPEPEVDRNPKAADLGDATLVNLDTWFWVTDPQAVGGSAGERTVRASLPDLGIWAEVTATTPGLSLASPAGQTRCDPDIALRSWEPGLDDSQGCTVAFDRASVEYPEGFPVTARTEWTATWTGVDVTGAEQSGDFDPLSVESQVSVPVAEMQATVRP